MTRNACAACAAGRRRFLGFSLRALAGAALVGPLTSLTEGCGKVSNGFPTIPNSSTGVYSFPFSTYPQLQTNGGCVQANIQATSGTKVVSVTRINAVTASTVSAVCTHESCTLNAFNSSTSLYNCPCHGSVFNVNGGVVTGPATTALASFSSVVGGSDIQVTIA